jgi:short-subunit dehydrogenase
MKAVGIITGAGSGIGKAFACELAKTHDLILIGRDREKLRQLSNDLKQFGCKTTIYAADLSNEHMLKRIEKCLSKTKADILINSAGFGDSCQFDKTSTELIHDMIYVHVLASTRLSRIVLPGMIEQKHGAIINVASVSGFSKVAAGNLIYDSAKAYLIRFSELLQQIPDVKGNVKVQVLCPGFTETDFFRNHQHKVKIPHFLWMKAEDVVRRSLKKMRSGSTVCIPGWHNMIIAKLTGNMFFVPVLKLINRNFRAEIV